MSESIELILDQLDELEEQERHIKEAEYEIERLNNIIKEVREYIEDLYDVRFTDKDKRKILEILGGENNDK